MCKTCKHLPAVKEECYNGSFHASQLKAQLQEAHDAVSSKKPTYRHHMLWGSAYAACGIAVTAGRLHYKQLVALQLQLLTCTGPGCQQEAHSRPRTQV